MVFIVLNIFAYTRREKLLSVLCYQPRLELVEVGGAFLKAGQQIRELGSWPVGLECKINVCGGRKFSLDSTVAGKNSSYASLFLLVYLLSLTDL